MGRPGPALRAALVGAAITAVLMTGYLLRANQYGAVDGEPYVVGFPTSGVAYVLLSQGDGQAFAALATDPALQRPEQFVGQTADTRVGVEAAYRAQRPLWGYAAWVLSFGQPSLVPAAMILLTVVGGAMAVGGVAQLLVVRGFRRPELAILVLLLPGALLATSWMGPECLGLGLVALAVAWVGSHPARAAVLLTLAGFTRESMLLLPVVLALWFVLARRDVVRAMWMAVPVIAMGAWLLVVHNRFGAWPSEANAGRFGAPFVGLAESFGRMSLVDIGFVVVNAALLIVAILRRRDPLAWYVAACVVFITGAGWDVWLNRGAVNRVMLPAQVFAVVLWVTGQRDPVTTRPLEERRHRAPAAAS